MDFRTEYRKPTKKRVCCAKDCDSKMAKNLSLSFHAMPSKGTIFTRKNLFGVAEQVDKRSEWLRKLNVVDNHKTMFVCSLHFSENDYALPHVFAKKRLLKANAVPMPVETSKKQYTANLCRQKRIEQRSKVRLHKEKKQKHKSSTVTSENQVKNSDEIIKLNSVNNEENVPADLTLSVKVISEAEAEPEIHHDSNCDEVFAESIKFDESDTCEKATYVDNAPVNTRSASYEVDDKGVQVNSGDLCITLCNFIKKEKDLMTMCGIRNLKILHELVRLIDEMYPRNPKHLLTTLECIVLTTARLKLDVSFSVLALFFNNVSDVTVRNAFYDTVKKLASVLQATIMRVSKEEILRNMPKCFDKYRSTTSVLDCTEIKIQKPSCLKCRIKFYSYYKGDLTVKFMTEVSPGGILTYVSESFGGRASDKCIFDHSNILNHLESTRDAVMVDKGFLIDEECMQKRIKLIRPPFLRNQTQLSKQEAIENRDIASARVHIERMNQRIKIFQILNNKVPWYFLNQMDNIFTICCGLANLGSPILADDKF